MATASSFEDLKPEIEMHVRYLKSCGKRKWFSNKKIESKQTGEVLVRLDAIYFELRRHNKGTPGNAHSPGTHALAMYMLQEGLGPKFVKMWAELIKCLGKRGQKRINAFSNLIYLTHICWSFTNICRELGDELVANGVVRISVLSIDLLKLFSKGIAEAEGKDDDGDDDGDDDDDDGDNGGDVFQGIHNSILGVLHNCIRMSNQNRNAYRAAKAITALQQCRQSANASNQFKSLIILAYVVNEKEREILASSEDGLRELLNILENAVITETHHAIYKGCRWSAFEILDAINHLAINDTNKAEIEKHKGAIPAIVRMLQDEFSDQERRVAAETLWNLSFVESIRESEILQETIPTLETLVTSSNKDLRGACASALWEIKGRARGRVSTSSASVEDSPPTYEEAAADLEQSEAAPTKIMLSYQWDSQPLVKKIKDRLENARYSVWMDISNLEGDILGAMAEAVQKSDVFLMCITERYQESNSCRSEASYAYKLKKKIIPLLLEPGYEPDGWLGLLQGMNLYYSAHSDEELQKNMPILLKVIGGGENKSTEDSDTVDGPIQRQEQNTCQALPPAQTEPRAPPSRATTSVDEWSKLDVQNWLRENDLDDTSLARVKGKHLRKLNAQRVQNEGSFEEKMKSDYKIFGPSYLLFTDALEELFPN